MVSMLCVDIDQGHREDSRSLAGGECPRPQSPASAERGVTQKRSKGGGAPGGSPTQSGT